MTRWIAAVTVATASLALVADRHYLRAQSASDGAPGQWTTAQVATGVDSIAATVGGGILVIGGLHDSNVRFQASPQSGAVSSVAALSAPRWSGWAPVYQDYIYLVGGLTGTSLTGASYTRTIERLTYRGGASFTVQALGTLLPVNQLYGRGARVDLGAYRTRSWCASAFARQRRSHRQISPSSSCRPHSYALRGRPLRAESPATSCKRDLRLAVRTLPISTPAPATRHSWRTRRLGFISYASMGATIAA